MSSYTNPNHDGAGGQSQGPESGLDQTKKQVDEVVVIMKQNVDKVLERDSKLTELDTRADALQAGAAQFETNATSLQRKFWWQNMKMNLIIGGVIVIVIVIIILATTLPKKGGDDGDS